MPYTVNKLAKLSGVSVRTLHFYDEIGLLKPARYGENQYRYYEEEQLLLLQQILFYRELGFPLNEIQRILSSSDFDKLTALISHKKILKKNMDDVKMLIHTIDKTISHLRGKTKMKHEELYYGFDSEKQKQYEKDLVKEGVVTQEWMDKYKGKTKQWSQKEKDQFIQNGKDIMNELLLALKQQLKPSSVEVQAMIRKLHQWVGWNPTREGFIGLSERYQTPEFRKFYDRQHPDFLEFIVESMKIFAEKELK